MFLYMLYIYMHIYILLYTPFLHCTYHPPPLIYIRIVRETQKIWRSATRKPRRMKYRTRAAILFSNKKALILPSKLLLYYVYVCSACVRVYREVYMMVRILCNVICILPGTRAHITQGNSSGTRLLIYFIVYGLCDGYYFEAYYTPSKSYTFLHVNTLWKWIKFQIDIS